MPHGDPALSSSSEPGGATAGRKHEDGEGDSGVHVELQKGVNLVEDTTLTTSDSENKKCRRTS